MSAASVDRKLAARVSSSSIGSFPPRVLGGQARSRRRVAGLEASRPRQSLSRAWEQGVGGPSRMCFEVSEPEAAREVLALLDAPAAEIASVATDGDLPNELAAVVEQHVRADPDVHLVLTGRAQSIRRIRARLKNAGLRPRAQTVKAYWDENRAGLD